MNILTTDEFVNLSDFENAAARLLSRAAFDYYVSGAEDELTLRENRLAFQRIEILPRMLRDVSERRASVNVFGRTLPVPLLIAPCAMQKLAHPDGEIATARAAEKAGVPMVLSTLSTFSLEDVSAASSALKWFQLYVYKDRDLTRSLVERAEAAGYEALVVTVDSPILGRRERDIRNRFQLPRGLCLANFSALESKLFHTHQSGSGLAAYIASLYDTGLSWKHIEWLQSITKLPVLIKGIMRPDDALLALQNGVAGIIVSNHGARQLDTVASSISVLPAIAAVIEQRIPLLIDGGIRRGTDILKAVALGADAVMVGRPILWGLTCQGEQGALAVLKMLITEFDLAMALSGCRSLCEITADLVRLPGNR